MGRPRPRRDLPAGTPTGAEVRYRLEPALAEQLLDLIRAEAGCCPGLTFEATVTLAVSAPEEMRAAVRRVVVGG